MKDDVLSICKIKMNHIDNIYKIYSDKGVIKNQNVYPMKSKKEAYLFFVKNHKNLYIIRLNNAVIGLLKLSKLKKYYKINFIIEKQYRNKGYMRRALSNFLSMYGGRKKIIAFVNPHNIAAIKVLELLNFKKERILYNYEFNLYTKKYEDIMLYSYICSSNEKNTDIINYNRLNCQLKK